MILAAQTPIAAKLPPPPEAIELPEGMLLDGFLQRGLLREGLEHFSDPTGNEELFSLAILQALDGFQSFLAGLNRFNYQPQLEEVLGEVPFLRFIEPGFRRIPGDQATPEKIATLFADLHTSLKQANATVSAVSEADFQVEVNLSRIRLEVGTRDPASARTLQQLLNVQNERVGSKDCGEKTPAGLSRMVNQLHG